MKNRECMDCNISIANRHTNAVRCETCQSKDRLARLAAYKASKKCKEKNNEYQKAYYQRNKERYKKLREKSRVKMTKELADQYILKLLRSKRNEIILEKDQITPELIEMKRKVVLLKRILRAKN